MRVLALDMGERRTGVALSDSLGWLATPLTVLECASREVEFAAIAALVQKHQVEQVVVGYPRSLNGSLGPQARRVDKYVERLRTHLCVPVVLWEEQFSTVQAEQLIHQTGRRVNRKTIDAAAAAVVLQSYLDAVSSSANTGEVEATAPSSDTERLAPRRP